MGIRKEMRMMRNRTVGQERLYQQYAALGKQIAEWSVTHQQEDTLFDNSWKLISKAGLWKLPVPIDDGGLGLSWQEWLIAMEGLASTYHDPKFCSLIINQISTLYLLLRYGTEKYKECYLPCLTSGEMASILIAEFHLPLDTPFSITKQRTYQLINTQHQNISIANASIIILVTYTYHPNRKNDVAFFLFNKESQGSVDVEKFNFNGKDLFLSTEKSRAAFYDLINFMRLLYGVMATTLMESTIQRHKRNFQNLQARVMGIPIKTIYEGIERNLRNSRRLLSKSTPVDRGMLKQRLTVRHFH